MKNRYTGGQEAAEEEDGRDNHPPPFFVFGEGHLPPAEQSTVGVFTPTVDVALPRRLPARATQSILFHHYFSNPLQPGYGRSNKASLPLVLVSPAHEYPNIFQ